MNIKKIRNIVIYKTKEAIKSCVFYEDGTYEDGTYEDGLNACEIVAKERNVNSKDAFRDMMNHDIVYVMSEKEFKEKFDTFKPEINKIDMNEIIAEVLEQDENIEEEIDSEEVIYEEDYNGDYYEEFNEDSIDEEEIEEEIDEEDNFFNNAGLKLRENNLGIKIGAAAVGLLVGIGLFTYCHRRSKEGKIENSNITTTNTTIEETYESTLPEENITVEYNNDLYDDYTFSELLDVTTNEFQRNSMINLSASLNGFNGSFAENYIEAGNDIRAALSFDEVVALQQAYNNYSIDEVRAYFNGYEVNAIDMSNAYKNASLQLMGAYVIETSQNPVDMSILIDSQEGRDFYERYHSMFLAAKEATGEERIRLVNEFYQAVREDFPITEEVRTEGISHSEAHNSLEDYQLAVAPMIAAAEMMFQNLDVDYTLNTIENNISEIDFINDIGLCNHADDKFERLETIMLGSYEDNTNPLYEQYKNAIIAELQNNNNYVIDDSHRELANLRSFQTTLDSLNIFIDRFTIYEGNTYISTTSSQAQSSSTSSTRSWEESTTTTWTETTYTPMPITPEAQAAIDAQIARDNAVGYQISMTDAQAEAARLQAEADRQAALVEAEIAAFNQQTQDQINDINNVINNGGTPNENNYSHVDFDDNHSDRNGNLDDSVENVTTNPSGADQPLPDPNRTGAEFDARSNDIAYSNPEPVTINDNNISDFETAYIEYVETIEGGAYIEYEEDYILYDENGEPIIASDAGYQYTR